MSPLALRLRETTLEKMGPVGRGLALESESEDTELDFPSHCSCSTPKTD